MNKKDKPNIEEPERAGDTRRPGKKSIPWRDDPEILQRLAKVSKLMNNGSHAFEIAMETKVSLATANLDISRVREIWKADAEDRLKNSAETAIAQYGAVIAKAWEDIGKLQAKNANRAALLNVIIRAQDRIDKVTGIADPIGGPNGGPIPIELVDVEKIRKQRWKAIEGKLKEIENKGRPTA
jgi:hypothetical protein